MVYFLLYLFLETLVSVNISSAIGGFNTFLEILLSALVGIFMLANFRETFVSSLMAVATRQIDMEEFQRLNLFTLIGAVLLIVPGFLTDFIGILMQFSIVTTLLINRFGVKSTRENFEEDFYKEKYTKKEDDEIIDVEIISEHNTLK